MKIKNIFGTALIFLGIAALYAGLKQLEGEDKDNDPLLRLLKRLQAGKLTEDELKEQVSDLKIPDMYVLRKVLLEREDYELATIVRDELKKKHEIQ